MFVINAPGAAVQKMIDRGCVICRFFDKSAAIANRFNTMRFITIPIDRIIVLQKSVFTINNMDLFIPGSIDSNYYDSNSTYGIIYATIDFVEPNEYGNIFATIGNRDCISVDEFNFMMQLTKDTIARLAVDQQNIDYMYSTQLACLPKHLKEELSQYDKSVITEEHPNEVMVATKQTIPLQQVVEKINPKFIKEYTDPRVSFQQNMLYNEEELKKLAEDNKVLNINDSKGYWDDIAF